MKLTSIQKAKLILRINFAILFLLIVLTPKFINQGVAGVSEDFVEGTFLLIELLALVIVFNHYEAEISKQERETFALDAKLKKKERELLQAFEYLGKVNVQVSMIRELFAKMEVPSTKSQLKNIFSELLKIVCSVSKEECAVLRIVNLESGRMMSEFREENAQTKKETSYCNRIEIGSRDLVNKFEVRNKEDMNGYCIYYSNAENFLTKAFVLVPNERGDKVSKDERAFLEAIANQCEIMFLLFSSKYYKNK